MGTIIGVVVGYALGTRAGPEGWAELQEAWRVISTSEEVRDMLTGALAVTKDLLGQATGVLAGRLGNNHGSITLRPVA